ncbi:hypothetical protein HAX54_046132 [Datura stramonium]|uniref:Uncharacterized protein n=1 Tax=Datura stramonium TaxID=4076 RepID=A0ABS8SRJ4_DATST|nr:hypothetical protein [Datura stramonium]
MEQISYQATSNFSLPWPLSWWQLQQFISKQIGQDIVYWGCKKTLVVSILPLILKRQNHHEMRKPHGLQHMKLVILRPFMAFSPSRKPVRSEEHLNVVNFY